MNMNLTDLIVRDCCEAEPADPDHPDTIRISVDGLNAILRIHLGELRDGLAVTLRRAYSLGQTYWQQADSEYTSQHRKADETQAKFEALVSDVRQSLDA